MDKIKVAPKGSGPAFGGQSVAVLVSGPESVLFHYVQPHELERLMRIERPFSLAIASAATGYALGVLPLLRETFRSLKDLPKVDGADLLWDIIYFMSFAFSIGIAVITWFNAVRGRSDAKKFLEEIQNRPQSPASPVT